MKSCGLHKNPANSPMNNFYLKSFFLLASCSAAFNSFADGLDGCVNSPENPTAVLALIGMAAAGAPWIKEKIRQHKNKHTNHSEHDAE